jgi:hypothetical protein
MTLLKTPLKRQLIVALNFIDREITMAQVNTTQEVQTSLKFIDHPLESSAEQTIQITEMIIDDIKHLTAGYQKALKIGSLHSHSELVRDTQMNWVNQLHDIILEQANPDLNGQVIQALQKFASSLNEHQLKISNLDLPMVVTRQQDSEQEQLDQAEIEFMINQQNLFSEDIRH